MSGGKTLADLKALIDFMRAEGIVECDGIKLGPKPAATQPDLDPEPEVKKIVKLGKKGRDGLTYDQQVELYNEARDATPDVYEE